MIMLIDQNEKKLLGALVRQARLARKLSRYALASRADISPSYLVRIENEGVIPTQYVLARLAYVLSDSEGKPERFPMTYNQLLQSAGLESPERKCLSFIRDKLSVFLSNATPVGSPIPDQLVDYASRILDKPAFYPEGSGASALHF